MLKLIYKDYELFHFHVMSNFSYILSIYIDKIYHIIELNCIIFAV